MSNHTGPEPIRIGYVGSQTVPEGVATACGRLDCPATLAKDAVLSGDRTDEHDVVVCDLRGSELAWQSVASFTGDSEVAVLVLTPQDGVGRATAFEAGVDAVVVDTEEWPVVFRTRLEQLVAASDRLEETPESDPQATAAEVRTLRRYVADATDCETRRDTDDLCVDAAFEFLDASLAVLLRVEDGEVHPTSAVGTKLHLGRNSPPAEAGWSGRALEAQSVQYVPDLRGDDVTTLSGGTYRTGVWVPLDDGAVLQVLDTRPEAFPPASRELAVLLGELVGQTQSYLDNARELQAERDWFSALFANIPSAAVEFTTEDGVARIENVNSQFVRLFGYRPEQAIGTTVEELVVPEEEPDGPVPERQILDEARGDRTAEVQRLTADGLRSFLLHRVPVERTEGEVRGYFIYTDITARKQRERDLTLLKQVLSRVLRHNLRNALTAVKGQASYIAEQSDELASSASAILKAAEDLLQTSEKARQIQQLLESGDRTTTTPIEEILADPVRSLREEYPDSTIKLADLPETPVTVHVGFELAIRNLVENGIIHTHEDPHVVVSARETEHLVEVTISDDGPGIPPQEVEVLEMGDETDLQHGSGAGLWLVDWLVRKSDGRLSFEADSEGTTVQIRLSQGRPDAEADGEPSR